MLTKIFTVYDTKAKAYMPPFYMQSTGQAMRAFEDTVNDETHAFAKHPEDYVLYELGTFDDQNASFQLHKTGVTLAKAIEMIAQPETGLPELLQKQSGDR